MKASIVIVTYNNLERYTKKCFNSIVDSLSSYQDYEIIFVDNASSDGTREWLRSVEKKFSNVIVLYNNKNEGYARANNIGIMNSSGDYIVLLNNDTVVSHDWLETLIEKFNSENIGLVGPITNSITSLQEVSIPGINKNNWQELSQSYTSKFKNCIVEVKKLCFFCVVIPRYVINDVGLLDENFGLGNFEDDDYCIRVRRKYKILMTEDVFIWHYGSGSFSQLSQQTLSELYLKNKDYISRKYNLQFLRVEQLDELVDFIVQVGSWPDGSNKNISYRSKYITYIYNMINEETQYLLKTRNTSLLRSLIKKIDRRCFKGFISKLYARI